MWFFLVKFLCTVVSVTLVLPTIFLDVAVQILLAVLHDETEIAVDDAIAVALDNVGVVQRSLDVELPGRGLVEGPLHLAVQNLDGDVPGQGGIVGHVLLEPVSEDLAEAPLAQGAPDPLVLVEVAKLLAFELFQKVFKARPAGHFLHGWPKCLRIWEGLKSFAHASRHRSC